MSRQTFLQHLTLITMKTVVIIENEAIELKALVDLFEHWQKEINILTAQLARMPHEDVYVIPAVREMLNEHAEKSKIE